MAQTKLIATGDIVLPEGMDVFEGAKHAEKAKHVLDQAATEIAKSFPGFKFHFTTGTYRDPSKPQPGRRPRATAATPAAPAEVAAAA